MVAAWLPLREAGAVVSHESALQLHDLSPGACVPPRHSDPTGYGVYRAGPRGGRMRHQDNAAFRQALERWLKERWVGQGARLARDRKRVAFDRS